MSENVNYASSASLRNIRISPRKARLVADLIRGRRADDAIRRLQFCNKKAAPLISKLLVSAIHNAREKESHVDIDDLYVAGLTVDMGRTLKRFLPRAQGRASNIKKRSSNVTLHLATTQKSS